MLLLRLVLRPASTPTACSTSFASLVVVLVVVAAVAAADAAMCGCRRAHSPEASSRGTPHCSGHTPHPHTPEAPRLPEVLCSPFAVWCPQQRRAGQNDPVLCVVNVAHTAPAARFQPHTTLHFLRISEQACQGNLSRGNTSSCLLHPHSVRSQRQRTSVREKKDSCKGFVEICKRCGYVVA